MDITITLTEKELFFIKKMMDEMKSLGKKDASLSDAVHQCIAMAMYEEAEEGS